MPVPPRVARACALVAALGVACSALPACSDEPENTEAAYCDEVQANVEALNGPNVATGADIAPLIDRYRAVANVAPATVEPEWRELVSALETASTVIPGDTESLEIATKAALAGQPAYTRIQRFTQDTCGIALGTPPPPTNPVTATTVVPPSTTG